MTAVYVVNVFPLYSRSPFQPYSAALKARGRPMISRSHCDVDASRNALSQCDSTVYKFLRIAISSPLGEKGICKFVVEEHYSK